MSGATSSAPSRATNGVVSGVVNADPDVLIEVRGLCVDYGLGDDAVHAVVEADLELRRGTRTRWAC